MALEKDVSTLWQGTVSTSYDRVSGSTLYADILSVAQSDARFIIDNE
jgi:hypothetical protein